jgi:cation diffusion facilitator CzcD-associated flavoprotein CzcO
MTVDREDEARYDVVVVGAGLSGLYVLKKLREAGLRAVVFEAGSDVGGTWYWNSYPGARCDVATLDYTYSFDPGLEDAWHWSEKYATQPEIERYIQFVADRYDLRRDIRFETRVSAATWDGNRSVWLVETDGGDALSASFVVMATGCLSVPKEPDLPGLDRFAGNVCRTGTWPRQPVSFEGSRVAVIGTGSSGVQAIPVIASQAKSLPSCSGPRALCCRQSCRCRSQTASSGLKLIGRDTVRPPGTHGAGLP